MPSAYFACLYSAYEAGQRVFGENYAKELAEKAQQLPKDISWHFIGSLQSNKCKLLVENVENLTIETLSSCKTARILEGLVSPGNRLLPVFIQVNTSGEESKSGLAPGEEVVALAKHIKEECPHLVLKGLMTIGSPGEADDFATLVQQRDLVQREVFSAQHDKLELSMGMSGDYEQAIAAGSTSV
ncbi:MAG: hypothetical protein SGCHY_002469, partial [Lobulomycetales sp.]